MVGRIGGGILLSRLFGFLVEQLVPSIATSEPIIALGPALCFALLDGFILAQPFTTMTELPSVFALIAIATCVCSRVSVFPYFPPMSSQPLRYTLCCSAYWILYFLVFFRVRF